MKLMEIAALTNPQLAKEQQECLLRLYMNKDTDPSTALQTISGDVKLMASAEYLIKAGMLTPVNGGYVVSQRGVNELVTAGALDENGVTDIGRRLIGQPPPKPQAPKAQASAPTSSPAVAS